MLGLDIKIKDPNSFTFNTIPKHYSFYILNEKEVYEFTPFQFCIEELLFPNQNSKSTP